MIQAIRQIGQDMRKGSGKTELETLVMNPGFSPDDIVISIVWNLDCKEYSVEQSKFDQNKVMKYLYRKGPPNGSDITPCSIMQNGKKTFERLKRCMTGLLEHPSLEELDKKEILETNKMYLDNYDDILSTVQNIEKTSPSKTKKLLTFQFLKQGVKCYLGDMPVFKKIILAGNQKIKLSQAPDNELCCLCGSVNMPVNGRSGVFKFYTVDKPGFIAGGFNEEQAWKNYPVCRECELDLEEGKKTLEKLRFKFCHLSYNIIPKYTIESNEKDDVIDILFNTSKKISLKNNIRKRITEDENEILDLLADKKDSVSYNLLFLQKKQSAERILLLIEDVFPSRLKKIIKAAEIVDKCINRNFTFADVRKFFEKSDKHKKNSWDLDKYFLEIVDRIFRNAPFDRSFLFRHIMKKLRADFSESHSTENNFRFSNTFYSGIGTLKFLQDLKVIYFEEDTNMEKSIFDPVFYKYGSGLNTPVRRGLFLTGVLTRMLLNKQYKERKAAPFLKKIKSLKMREIDIKNLLPEVQNKFLEYDAWGKAKQTLAEDAYKYLLTCGENWQLSPEEINFYFAAGLNLYKEICEILYSSGVKDPDIELSEELDKENNMTEEKV